MDYALGIVLSVAVGFAIGALGDEQGEPPLWLSLTAVVVMIASAAFFFRTALTRGQSEPDAYGAPQPSYFGRKDAEAGIPG